MTTDKLYKKIDRVDFWTGKPDGFWAVYLVAEFCLWFAGLILILTRHGNHNTNTAVGLALWIIALPTLSVLVLSIRAVTTKKKLRKLFNERPDLREEYLPICAPEIHAIQVREAQHKEHKAKIEKVLG